MKPTEEVQEVHSSPCTSSHISEPHGNSRGITSGPVMVNRWVDATGDPSLPVGRRDPTSLGSKTHG